MSRDGSAPDALSGFEKQLQSLRPSAVIDRDHVMFRAGQASAERGGHLPWRLLATTNGFSALAAGLLASVMLRSGPPAEVVDRPAPPRPVVAPREEGSPREFGYLALRNRAIVGDWSEPLAAAPTTGWEKAEAASSYRQLLEQYSQELR